jgi:hypothetical protein
MVCRYVLMVMALIGSGLPLVMAQTVTAEEWHTAQGATRS